jgi:glycosyltransferase involved in cell wall biosynthesis
VLRQNHFPQDPRVRREVRALLDEGYEVDVLCTRRRGEPLVERDGRLRVVRLPLWHRRGGATGYVAEYLLFHVAATVGAGLLHLRRRYGLVQVHTLPDSLVFAAALPRLAGAPVLLDLHECMPEFFATKFGLGLDHPAVRLIGAVEQGAIRFADRAITCTDQMRDAFVGRGAPEDRIDVVLNAADEGIFDPRRHPGRPADDRFVLVCHGALEERYGLDTAIRAVGLLAGEIGGLRLEIYGEGSEAAALKRLAAELGVSDRVWFSDGFVPIDDLVAAIARADAGVVAVKPDPFRDLTHCNKMYDFIAMGRPVLVSRTASTAAYFDDSCFAWFRGDDAEDLARAVRALHADPDWRTRLVSGAERRSQPYRWAAQQRLYLAAVERAGATADAAVDGDGARRRSGHRSSRRPYSRRRIRSRTSRRVPLG